MKRAAKRFPERIGQFQHRVRASRVLRRHAARPSPSAPRSLTPFPIRARVPLEVLRDTIQPFPTFSEIYVDALKALHGQITRARRRISQIPQPS